LPEAGTATVPAPAAAVAALASEIDLGRLRDLTRQFSDARLSLSVDALLLRAAVRSLAGIGIDGAIAWETGSGAEKRRTIVAGAKDLSPGALQAALSSGVASTPEPDRTALSIRRLGHSGIRAVSMPLRPDDRLRLVLSGDEAGTIGCLFCFDIAVLDEDQAVEFVARFKDDIETPLRLLA
jgi:hypothetical protein